MSASLLDEVMDALGDMVDMTCPMMRVLWLDHSRAVREEISTTLEPLPDYPPYLTGPQNKPKRSKYRALAGWRHVVVWQSLLGDRTSEMARVYFQPAPDVPPFSYSQRTSAAPGVPPDASVTQVRRNAARQIEATLVQVRPASEPPLSLVDRHRRMFIDLGRTKALRDVLKLEDADDALFLDRDGT